MSVRIDLPPFTRPVRLLRPGEYPFLALLPSVAESPALRRIAKGGHRGEDIVSRALVHIRPERSFCWVDVSVPCIVLAQNYYETGSDLDLDLLHEVTHVRQHLEGRDLWDASFPYHKRPTEIEGYAVAVEEGRRL